MFKYNYLHRDNIRVILVIVEQEKKVQTSLPSFPLTGLAQGQRADAIVPKRWTRVRRGSGARQTHEDGSDVVVALFL